MLVEARVYRGISGNYSVRAKQTGADYVVRLRGNLKKDLVYNTSLNHPRRVTSSHKRRMSDPITVGDNVLIDAATSMIEEVLPRTSELSRLLPLSHEQHVLVANIETLFVVFAAADPRPDLFLLDRFLVMSESSELHTEIILNKMDKATDPAQESALDVYEKIGYPLHKISAKAGIGVDGIRDRIKARISAFTGPSGVGKSSLLNAIHPGLALKTGDVGLVTHTGRHTTTTAELIAVEGATDTWVADTPGLRQLDFWEVEAEDMDLYFPEMKPFVGLCRYANCRHWCAEGCAIYQAVVAGSIDTRRYRSYVQLSGGPDAHARDALITGAE